PGHPPYRCPGCPTSQRGPYRVIVADPPWLFKSNSAAKPGRNALAHYDCMSVDEIAAMPVHDYAAPDCVLFLWVTTPMLVIGAGVRSGVMPRSKRSSSRRAVSIHASPNNSTNVSSDTRKGRTLNCLPVIGGMVGRATAMRSVMKRK